MENELQERKVMFWHEVTKAVQKYPEFSNKTPEQLIGLVKVLNLKLSHNVSTQAENEIKEIFTRYLAEWLDRE